MWGESTETGNHSTNTRGPGGTGRQRRRQGGREARDRGRRIDGKDTDWWDMELSFGPHVIMSDWVSGIPQMTWETSPYSVHTEGAVDHERSLVDGGRSRDLQGPSPLSTVSGLSFVLEQNLP